MAGLLVQFLMNSSRQKFQYGETDCAQWVSQYIHMTCGIHPGLELKGDYYDEATCAAVLAKSGGLLQLVSEEYAKYPDCILPCIDDPPMDAAVVAVVEYMGVQFTSVRTRGGWALKKRDIGYHVVPWNNVKLRVLKKWRLLECPRL